MFQHAPSSVFRQSTPLDPPDDFYMKSGQVSSADEDIRDPVGFSVRLTDFGTCRRLNSSIIHVLDLANFCFSL